MIKKETELGKFLAKIADELNITETMYDKAVQSYTAVGKWLGDGLNYTVEIMPQGSMNLGTAVRPVNENDDYDIDLVCLLHEGWQLDAKTIKELVGKCLKEHETYNEKLEEGRRCWKMNYDGFHMDILPCVPKNRVFMKNNHTEIRLTHKNDNGTYLDKYSNPYGYKLWFEQQMLNIYNILREKYAAEHRTIIDDVPFYKVRTPLQQSIQLLKRHRDIMFSGKSNIAPISIIITTLAAKAYNNEIDLYEALNNILDNMPIYIENRNGVAWVENPVMPDENFADKWQIHPEKKVSFYSWVKHAKQDLISNPLEMFGIDTIGNHYKKVLGELPVNRALNSIGDEMRHARSSGTLYINGLSGGISTTRGSSSKKIEEHTFFGQ